MPIQTESSCEAKLLFVASARFVSTKFPYDGWEVTSIMIGVEQQSSKEEDGRPSQDLDNIILSSSFMELVLVLSHQFIRGGNRGGHSALGQR